MDGSSGESLTPVGRSHAVWRSGLLFEAGVGGRTHAIDADSKTAPSPVETLLGSLGTCAASDLLDFLEKRRTPATRLDVDVFATRRAEYPRRVMTLEVTFTVEGDAIEREQAERGVRLSFERYCTVAASLAGDIELKSILVLNGEAGAPVKQAMFSASFP